MLRVCPEQAAPYSPTPEPPPRRRSAVSHGFKRLQQGEAGISGNTLHISKLFHTLYFMAPVQWLLYANFS